MFDNTATSCESYETHEMNEEICQAKNELTCHYLRFIALIHRGKINRFKDVFRSKICFCSTFGTDFMQKIYP